MDHAFNTTPHGTVAVQEYWKSEASDYSTSSPWTYNGSVITGGVAGEWGEINVGEKVYVNKLELMANSPYIFRSPEKFHLLGSNDGNTWTTLLTKKQNTDTYRLPNYAHL